MSPALQRVRTAVLAIGGLLAFLLVFAWLALPGILQSQAQKIVAEKSGHHLTLGKPEINPLALSLRLKDLKLDDPEGAPLLAFRELFVDLSAASLATRGMVVEQLKLDGLAASAILRDDAQRPHNWSRLLAAFASKEEAASGPPPRIEIRQLQLRGAQIDIADQRTAPPFASRVEAFDLELHDISTRPDDSGQFHLAAKTAFGAELEWKGTATLTPLASAGQLRLRGLDLGKLAPLLAPRLPPQLGFVPPEGIVGLTLDYRLGHANGTLALTLDPFAVDLANIVLRKPKAPGAPTLAVKAVALQGARFDLATQQLAFQSLTVSDASLESGSGKQRTRLVALPEISLAPARIDLAAHAAEIGAVSLKNGRITAHRDAEGGIDLLATLQALAPAPAAKPGQAADASPPSAPWRFTVERVGLAGFGLGITDQSMAPALQLGIDEVSIETSGISEKLSQPLPLKAALRVASGGRLALEGKLVPASAAIDLQLKLDGLSLKPAQPLIGRHAALDLADGRISAAGRVQHDAKSSAYRGSFAIDALRLNEAGSDKVFLGWKSLGTRQLEITPQKLQIGELLLDGLDTQLLIAKDGSTNFKRILRQADAPTKAEGTPATVPPAPTPAAVPAPAAAPAPAANGDKAANPGPSFLLNIDRLRFRDGELDFADESLIFPFGTRIHKLRGSIAGLSSRPGAAGQLELDGQVDDFGMARAVGQVDPFDPTGFTEIKLVFRNLEMTRLTPYSATFAGRRIDSGKLSLDLDYNIRKRQLQSHNQVVIDKLVLGERVQSPSAKDLPLDLAIALLEDSDGRIDLGLPITGSLDDPQFSYGAIVWKVITNVLGKIVTAPFRALGAPVRRRRREAGKHCLRGRHPAPDAARTRKAGQAGGGAEQAARAGARGQRHLERGRPLRIARPPAAAYGAGKERPEDRPAGRPRPDLDAHTSDPGGAGKPVRRALRQGGTRRSEAGLPQRQPRPAGREPGRQDDVAPHRSGAPAAPVVGIGSRRAQGHRLPRRALPAPARKGNRRRRAPATTRIGARRVGAGGAQGGQGARRAHPARHAGKARRQRARGRAQARAGQGRALNRRCLPRRGIPGTQSAQRRPQGTPSPALPET
jgi:hypothetical protein